MNVRQPVITPLEAVNELRVVKPQQVEPGRLQVVDVHLIVRDRESQIVGFPMHISAAGPAPCDPHAEAIGIMIATQDIATSRTTLSERSPAKLAAAND